MPISCFGVNRTRDEKLVPITRHNGDYIVSERHVMMLTLLKCSPENGPFWELEAENSQQAAREDALSVKIVTSDVYSREGF
jgi:hypothetical protein